jgi:hypothetical protein
LLIVTNHVVGPAYIDEFQLAAPGAGAVGGIGAAPGVGPTMMQKIAERMSKSLDRALSKAADKVSRRNAKKQKRGGRKGSAKAPRGGKSGCGRRCKAKLQKRIDAVNRKIAAEKAKKSGAKGSANGGPDLDAMLKEQLADNTDWAHKVAKERLSVEARKAEADLAEGGRRAALGSVHSREFTTFAAARVKRLKEELAQEQSRKEGAKNGFEANSGTEGCCFRLVCL